MCTCDKALELISARLDGVITPEEAALLEEHLSACPACRDLLADLEGVHEAMPGLWVEPPADLKDRIMDRIRSDNVTPLPVRPARKVRWKGWAALAAVCAVALLGAGSLRYLNGNLAGSSTGAAAPMEAAADAAGGGESGADAGAGGDSYAPSSAPAGDEATQFTTSDGAASSASGGASAPQTYDDSSQETESAGESRMTEEAAPAATAVPEEAGKANGTGPAVMAAALPEYTALEQVYQTLGGAGSYTAQSLPNPSLTGLLLSRAEGAPDGTPAQAVLVYVGTETADSGETRWIFHLHPLGEAGDVDPAAGYTLCTVLADGTAEIQAVTPADGASCGNDGCAAALEEG